jgi:hypothetical protein
MWADKTMYIYNNVQNVIFYLRRQDFIMFLKISQLNGPLQKKKKPSKYTPTTTNPYDFARKSGRERYLLKLSIK